MTRTAAAFQGGAPARRGVAARIRTAQWRAVRELVNAVVGSHLVPRLARHVILRAYLDELGTTRISARCFFGGRKVAIGRASRVNIGCLFDEAGGIRIGAGAIWGWRSLSRPRRTSWPVEISARGASADGPSSSRTVAG